MKHNFKKVFRYSLLFIVFILISVFLDLLVFNFNLLSLDVDERNIVFDEYEVKNIDNKRNIIIDLDGQYVNKLNIKYLASNDVEFFISYLGDDYYKNDKLYTYNDFFNSEVDEVITNCNNNIYELRIIMDDDSDVEIKKISIDNNIKINYFRVIYMFSIMLIVYIIYRFYKKGGFDEKIHRYFFVLGLIIGSTMIFIQPDVTFYSWDDQIHFLRTYELVGGNLEWKNGEFSMIDSNAFVIGSINSLEEQENLKEYLNSDIDSEIKYNSYSSRFITYDKICYIPSAIGFYLAKLLHLPFVICFRLGKFMNLLTYLLFMSYAIKITKNFKKLLIVIGFIPTSIFLACQYSYDGAVMGGITLSLVVLFNWILIRDSKVDFKSMCIFIFSILYGCFPKAIYAPLLLLFLFVPSDKFKNKKESLLLKIGIIIICLLLLSTFVLPVVTTDVSGDPRGGNTSVSEQMKVIFSNPVGYINVLNDTMVNQFNNYFLGKDILGNYSYMGLIDNNLYFSFLVLLLFVLFTEETNKTLNLKNKFIILLGIIGIILLIWTALYLSFTPVGLNTINGVQPRYFIPLLLPLFCLLKIDKIKNNISLKIYNTIILGFSAMIVIISLYNIFILNYCM